MGIRETVDSPLGRLILIIIIFGVVFFGLDFLLLLFGQTIFFTHSFLLPFIVGAFSSYFVSFLLLDKYFESNANIKFSKSFGSLLGEINYNHSKSASFCLNGYIQQARENWLNHTVYWIPEKHPSFIPWSIFFFHYLPVNAYYFFINQEFIMENRLDRVLLVAIGRYYTACFNFSQLTQEIENDINPRLSSITPEEIEHACARLHTLAERYLPDIEDAYNTINHSDTVVKFNNLHPEMVAYE